MGLFGYGKGDYNKNTEQFKAELLNFMMEGVGVEVARIINATITNLENNNYPEKCNNKALKAIDERIKKIIGLMKKDIQNKKAELLSAHASMLASAVADSRKFGKELLTPQELEAEEITAECKAQLFEILTVKEQNNAKMAELLEQAKRSPDKIERIKVEYNEIATRTANIDKQISVITTRHNTNIQILNARDIGKTYVALPPQIISVQEFNVEIAKINKIAAQEAGYNDAINEVAAGLDLGIPTSSITSPFDDAFTDAFVASNMQDFDSTKSAESEKVLTASEEYPFENVLGSNK